MALLEQLQRKINRMGLVPRLVKGLPRLSLLLTLAGVCWLAMLPTDGQFRHTYMSENALMPSQAYSFFRESEWNYLRGYRDEIWLHEGDSLADRNDMIQDWLDEIGLKTAVLNYTVPSTGESKPTLYGIYHASKGDDTEAIVLVAPWHVRDGQTNTGGLALGVSLARYFHRMSIWAKNIIVVFPEDGQDSLRNWVNAYHTSLDQTGGSILSAIVMEYPSGADGIDYVQLEYAGLNGQLPNLDLVNTAVMVSQHEGFRVSLHNAPKGQLWSDDFFNRLTTIVKAVYSYATTGLLPAPGNGGGNGCEAFSGWNIQAITLKAVGEGTADITSYGRIIEAVFRSVNNLLEKFHQSYFFYLMLGPELFVSIATYLPCAVLAASSFVITAVSSLLGNHNANNVAVPFAPQIVAPASPRAPILAILGFFCILSLSVLSGLSLTAVAKSYPYEESFSSLYFSIVYYGGLYPSVLVSLLPVISSYVIRLAPSQLLNDTVRFFNAFSLFFFAFTLIALLFLHFSLSFLISLAAFPVILVRYGPNGNKKTRLVSALCLLLSSPFLWIAIIGVVSKTNFQLDRVRNLIQYFQYGLLQREIQSVIDWCEEADWSQVLNGPAELLYGLVSGYTRFENWTWLFLAISWFPVWVCSAIVACVDVQKADLPVTKQKERGVV